MAAPTSKPVKDPKTPASKQHRRSRSGCFTCRLRRKKCDEAKPGCKACGHLGLKCEYKRPQWWGNSDQRRNQKDHIKDIIKRTQLVKKSSHVLPPLSANTPPSLCHSVLTSDGFSDFPQPYSNSRAVSTDESPLTSDNDFITPEGYFGFTPMHSMLPPSGYPMFSPYEIDIKTERQIFVNDVPTRRDSTLSTFSTYQPPPNANGVSEFPANTWIEQNQFESCKELFSEEPVEFEFFDFCHTQLTPTHESHIEVDEVDKPLLEHFFDKVEKLIFPVLAANQHGSVRSSVILPALESSKAYRHCCLDVAAVHKKSTQRTSDPQLDDDIMRHRCATISELCADFQQANELCDERSYTSVLEATLAAIFFHGCVGKPEHAPPEIPWHQHMSSVVAVAQNLDLPQKLISPPTGMPTQPPFNMTLTAWIDILGATMLGISPLCADTYRDLNIASRSAGLAELMGCEDHVMFLISEIACLEARKLEGMEEVLLCKYIEILGTEISISETNGGKVESAISASGAIRPKQLTINMTAVFRLAARIYLCAMVPGFSITSPSTINLVQSFCDAMEFIPGGIEGFDKSLTWPLLIAGSVSTAVSPFRPMLAERCKRLGDAAELGSFGRVQHILRDVWAQNDVMVPLQEDFQGVHWRDVMQQKGWDCLLI
ncbi:hypothetical protein MBLNU457_g2921t2 [Dothideomycetes sp. NU457]